MALQYYGGLSASSSGSVVIIGDGNATSIIIDLEAPPLNFVLKANRPITAIFTSQGGPSFTGLLNGDRTSITLTFSSPPSTGPNTAVGIQLYFGGQ